MERESNPSALTVGAVRLNSFREFLQGIPDGKRPESLRLGRADTVVVAPENCFWEIAGVRSVEIIEGPEMESVMSEWNRDLTMLPDQELLLLQLEKQIAERTDGRIRDLRVEAHGDGIVLSGRTTTYYMKQLASQIAMDSQNSLALQNSIEVI